MSIGANGHVVGFWRCLQRTATLAGVVACRNVHPITYSADRELSLSFRVSKASWVTIRTQVVWPETIPFSLKERYAAFRVERHRRLLFVYKVVKEPGSSISHGVRRDIEQLGGHCSGGNRSGFACQTRTGSSSLELHMISDRSLEVLK